MVMRSLIVALFVLMIVNVNGQNSNVKLLEFSSSSCDERTDPFRLRTRIINKSMLGSTLSLEIATTATCCVGFKPNIALTGDTLRLDMAETGSPCECTCCYQFNFKLKSHWPKSLIIKLNGKVVEESIEKFKTYPIKFEVRDGDTVNYVDKYGLMQGKWLWADGRNGYREMVNGSPLRYITLYPNGSIKTITERKRIFDLDSIDRFSPHTDLTHYYEYFETGMLKRFCHSQHIKKSYKEGNCKEWNDKGLLVYEGPYLNERFFDGINGNSRKQNSIQFSFSAYEKLPIEVTPEVWVCSSVDSLLYKNWEIESIKYAKEYEYFNLLFAVSVKESAQRSEFMTEFYNQLKSKVELNLAVENAIKSIHSKYGQLDFKYFFRQKLK